MANTRVEALSRYGNYRGQHLVTPMEERRLFAIWDRQAGRISADDLEDILNDCWSDKSAELENANEEPGGLPQCSRATIVWLSSISFGPECLQWTSAFLG